MYKLQANLESVKIEAPGIFAGSQTVFYDFNIFRKFIMIFSCMDILNLF